MNKVICGDALAVLRTMPDESVNTCVTSPPYFGLRNYGVTGQIGLETTTEEYILRLVDIFREVRRVLRNDGTLWVNIGDSYNSYKGNAKSDNMQSKYAGFRSQPARPGGYGLEDKNLKPKDLCGIPWMLAFALRADGWYLRQDIIWSKNNPMPESVTDRCTKSHEYIFLLSKSPKYYYDNEAVKEPVAEATVGRMKRGVSDSHKNINGAPGQTTHTLNKPRLNMKNMQYDGQAPNSFHVNRANGGEDKIYEKRNKRSVWSVSTRGYKGSHFAVFPIELITPCILAGCPENGIVIDPFFGSGTTGVAALMNGRNYIGIDLNPEYCELSRERIAKHTNT